MDPMEMLRSLLGGGGEPPEADEPTEPTDEAIATFWADFAADEHALADVGVTVQNVMAVHERLAPLGGAIVHELGPAGADGRLMLALSVDGIAEYAPWVEKIVAAAPPLQRWTVRAFRPPKPLEAGQPCGPNPLTPDTVFFAAQESEDEPGKVDVIVKLPDDVPPPLQSTFGFQLLDAAVGERTVMDHLAGIDFGDAADLEAWEVPEEALRPVTELPAVLRAMGVPVEAPRIV